MSINREHLKHTARIVRLKTQTYIIAEYGDDYIREAGLRLCPFCKRRGCNLLPVTSSGKDCPYFER